MPPVASRKLFPDHVTYLKSRGIDQSTAEMAGVYSIDAYMRDAGEIPALAFPYPSATKMRGVHVRAFSCQGSPQHYFMQDLVQPGQPLVICEGEIDSLSMLQAGVQGAISVPNGAPQSVSKGKVDPREDGKYKYVWQAKDLYGTKVVIATDGDEPGEALSEELARRIGKYRCWRVKWPMGIKDANEALVKLGPEALKELVEAAEPWPVAGLFETTHYEAQVLDLWAKGEAKGHSTGLSAVDRHYTVAPGQFTIVTGIPSNGKSEFIDHLMVRLAEDHGWRFAVCSFENPASSHIVKLLEKRLGKPFYEADHGGGDAGVTPAPRERISSVDVRDGLSWVHSNFFWIEQADGASSTIDDIIERAKVAVMRYGVRGVLIDPYNYIDKGRDVSETEFVSETLTKIKQFAVGHDVHVWFVAHPTKLKRDESGRIPPPGGYEISGSAAWFAKADCGITVHRSSEENVTEIHVWKVRFKWIGKTGMCLLAYDPVTGRYSDGREQRVPSEPIILNLPKKEETPYYTHY